MNREYLTSAMWIGTGMAMGVVVSKAIDPIVAYGAGVVLLLFHLFLIMRQNKANQS